MQPETTQSASQLVEAGTDVAAAPVDFYFKCAVLSCTMKASACEKNRKLPSKSEALILQKQTGTCKSCKDYAQQQQATAISIADFHAGISLSTREEPVRSIGTGRNQRSDWSGVGRSRTRLN